MTYIQDRWHRKDRTRTARYGTGMRWMVEYIDPSGKRVRKQFATKDEASVFHGEIVISVNQGTYVSPQQQQVTFGELWPRFERSKMDKAKKTQEAYKGAWKNFAQEKWAGFVVRNMTKTLMTEWLAGLKTKTKEPI